MPRDALRAEKAAAQEHAKVASGSKEHHRTCSLRITELGKNQVFSGLIPCQKRDVVILFVPAEFPSLMLGTAKTVEFGNPQRRSR
jgi:hypothetical protein